MNRDEWIEEFAGELGIGRPTPDEIDALLELAAIAAHASERTAAPVACWLAGLSGMSLERLKEVAEGIGSG
ncbi:MAG TPA: DUF6457 domain-containing protein [Solirubrobacterales bacterium]|nr:DUF6457 domain-containing protein [Solirubrobacterales bacterium]